MDKLRSLTLLLHDDGAAACNEPFVEPRGDATHMDADMFGRVMEQVSSRRLDCSVICGAAGLDDRYSELCRDLQAEVIVPAGCENVWGHSPLAVVFEMSQLGMASRFPSEAGAILRVRRRELAGAGHAARTLLGRFKRVSLRHPELLDYSLSDIDRYRNSLVEAGDSLVCEKRDLRGLCLEALAGVFGVTAGRECGAGVSSLLVDPQGGLHVCRAALLARMDSCGHILSGVEIADRHLMSRDYSLLCRDVCCATHCRRCVYLSRMATYEFCVPPSNLCRVSYAERAAQASVAATAAANHVWPGSFGEPPSPPAVLDPYEAVAADDEARNIRDTWSQMGRFTGRTSDLTRPMMLSVLWDIRGTIEAFLDCARMGVVPSAEVFHDALATARQMTIDGYRSRCLLEGCPSVTDIEAAMLEKCRGLLESGRPPQGECRC